MHDIPNFTKHFLNVYKFIGFSMTLLIIEGSERGSNVSCSILCLRHGLFLKNQ